MFRQVRDPRRNQDAGLRFTPPAPEPEPGRNGPEARTRPVRKMG
jgi:hypothetical protein